MELEDCKREVARERTRIIEQEELLKRQQQAALRAAKGKGRARDVSADTSLLHGRYKEAVEEKKGMCKSGPSNVMLRNMHKNSTGSPDHFTPDPSCSINIRTLRSPRVAH
jgi:hypothetical protein